MKLKVGVIGLGNAGGQIAALAKEAGMDAVAINVSSDDNATIEDMVVTFGIGNAMGSGKNRDRAKEFGKQSIRKVRQFASPLGSATVISSCRETILLTFTPISG